MPLTPTQRERYARQLVLPDLGAAGQRRLAAARVTIVGMGGLGSTAALYLAAAGVGQLQLIDPDPVERSNLHRQILYRDGQVGASKVNSARSQLLALNPDVDVITQRTQLTCGNAEVFFNQSHLILDGSDNFPTRIVINKACGALGLPWIYGAAEALHGQLSVFWPNGNDRAHQPGRNPCYICLFPTHAQSDTAGCAQRGVLGMVPGIIAQLQALEAIKLLTGLGTPLLGQLLRFDAATAQFRSHRFTADPQCECRHWPGSGGVLPGRVD